MTILRRPLDILGPHAERRSVAAEAEGGSRAFVVPAGPAGRAMSRQESRFHTFIVRCWLELPDSEASGQWRGEVRHLPGGEAMRFRDLADVLRFIRAVLEARGGQPAAGHPGDRRDADE
ncbi:MAG: hypothetical protein HY704_09540 [Gemmatimonadetes bacterium]|nr:hypothetical protein [Gemmatimonadota bacterium]